ncbi:MAG: endonuclease/exonuclease/phosphatase family protein [Deltaproteobacteria bacterium]|nr:endonuclease/exonuclease/phosphatase family protein [Deltaproteobacteria bacterium]
MHLRCAARSLLFVASLATAGACTPTGEFSLLTYNVHGLPGSVTGDDTEARMRAISPHLNDFDVAAIQENFFYGVALAESVEGRLAYHFTEMRPGAVTNGGLSVFSTLPASYTGGDPWQVCNGYLDAANDCLASKGFELVRLAVPFTPIEIDLYDLHLDAGNSPADDAARAAQTEQLLAAIETESAGRAVMVAGDFNMSIDDPEDVPIRDRLLSGAGLTDACAAVGCLEPDHIDQLFFRGGDTVAIDVTSWSRDESFVDDQGAPLSDHSPIVFGVAYGPVQP